MGIIWILIGVYVFLAVAVGSFGIDRSCGFMNPFLASLIFTPILGIIIILFSRSTQLEEDVKKQLTLQEQQLIEQRRYNDLMEQQLKDKQADQ